MSIPEITKNRSKRARASVIIVLTKWTKLEPKHSGRSLYDVEIAAFLSTKVQLNRIELIPQD